MQGAGHTEISQEFLAAERMLCGANQNGRGLYRCSRIKFDSTEDRIGCQGEEDYRSVVLPVSRSMRIGGLTDDGHGALAEREVGGELHDTPWNVSLLRFR